MIAIAAFSAATPAFAEEGASDRPDRDTIVVTGQRDLDDRTEIAGRLGLSVRETPAIVEVLTQEDFQIQGVRTAIEAMNAAPGVASGNLPGSIGSVSMRGFHRAVNYLYDGVRMANSDVGLRNWDSWAFERIEVIKGPASVTSGEGALAGAINFVPRRPKLGATKGEVLASYGSFDTARLAGDLNVPIGDTIAVRGNISWSRSSGWIDDTDSRTFAVSGSLRFQPSDRITATLSVDYFEDRFLTAYYGTPVVSRAVARDPSSAVSGRSGLVLDKAMRRTNFNLIDGKDGSSSTWLRARLEYALGDTLKLVSDSSLYDSARSFRDADEYGFNSASGLINRGAAMITHDHRFWSQRVHLAFDGEIGGLRNRFTAGLEVGHTDFFTQRRFGSSAAANPFRPIRGAFPADTPGNFATRQDVTADVDQRALFAENALNLTDRWLFVAGVRYDGIKLDRNVLNVTTGAAQRYGQTYHPISWRVGAVYSLAPRTQLFVQYNRAVSPIGGLLFLSASNAQFKLTEGVSYEAGIKASFAGGSLDLTGSAFQIRQNDILTRDPTNPARFLQGGSLESKGMEIALDWRPHSEIGITASGTLIDAKYKKLIETGGLDRTGNRPQNVPERLADFVLTYSPKALPVSLAASVRHNGNFFTENANVVKVNAFTTFDASIAWRTPVGTLTVRGRNLTDRFYADWSGYASGLVFIGAPRSFDISFTRRF